MFSEELPPKCDDGKICQPYARARSPCAVTLLGPRPRFCGDRIVRGRSRTLAGMPQRVRDVNGRPATRRTSCNLSDWFGVRASGAKRYRPRPCARGRSSCVTTSMAEPRGGLHGTRSSAVTLAKGAVDADGWTAWRQADAEPSPASPRLATAAWTLPSMADQPRPAESPCQAARMCASLRRQPRRCHRRPRAAG
jgi:hypothetical protein